MRSRPSWFSHFAPLAMNPLSRGHPTFDFRIGDWRLVEEHARSRGVEEPPFVGETRPTTLLVADPPTALAVTAEGASCAARAVPSDSVSCMLAARRVPTDRFADGVPGAGREPSASLMTNASSAQSVSPADSAAEARKFG